MAMQDDVVALGHHPLKLHAFARILPCHALEIIHEGLLAIANVRVVLDVLRSRVALDGLTRLALVKHEIVEGRHVALIPL